MKTKINKTESSVKTRNLFHPESSKTGFFAAQPKLNVGLPGDKYELEADKVSDTLINRQSETASFFAPAQPLNVQSKSIAETLTPLVQRAEEEQAQPKLELQCQEEEEEELQPRLEVQRQKEEEMLQMQPIEEDEELLQPKSERATEGNSTTTEQQLQLTRGNGSSLDAKTRAQMENGFGADFSGVKIHTNTTAVQMNKEIGAQAFTSGNDIYFNEGNYKPNSQNGKKLLAHELTHTIQQGASNVVGSIQREISATTSTVDEHAVDSSAATCDEATQREKEAFINHGLYGPRSLVPEGTRVGGFQASYNPTTETLQITVRGKTRFVDGLEVGSDGFVNSHESDLAGLARLLNYVDSEVLSNTVVSNYYTWNETQKETARNNFRQRISETIWTWQDEPWLQFRVNEPCWDDVRANVSIDINVQAEGEASYATATTTSNDHLQVTLVKNPERSEFSQVRSLIRTTAERVGAERMETIHTAAGLTSGASVDSNRTGRGRNRNPYDNEMTLSNLSLQNNPTEVNNFNRSMLRRSVKFARNESVLDSGDKARIDQFITDFSESDSDTSNSYVTLIGHASRLGSTSANRRLVAARLNSVMNYLREKGFPNIDTRVRTENRSDTVAESYPDTEGNADFFRMVEIVIGQGDLQNTVAHEFGHVFGLLDEYATVGTSFTGTGTAPGTEVGHSEMSDDIGAGRVQSENSDNIMSAGNIVRGQHYGPFGWALGEITPKTWRLV